MAITREEIEAEVKPPQEITWEEYLTEGHIEGPYEILEGVRYFMSGAEWEHQRIVINLSVLLRDYGRQTGRGKANVAPFDIVIRRVPRLRTRQPDVFFISTERLEQAGGIGTRKPLEVGPELVVEILSPSETPRRLRAKLEDYRSIGVVECWLVSPEAETVQLLRLTPDGYETASVVANGQSLTSLAFPDLTVALSDIFAE